MTRRDHNGRRSELGKSLMSSDATNEVLGQLRERRDACLLPNMISGRSSLAEPTPYQGLKADEWWIEGVPIVNQSDDVFSS